MKSLEVIFVAVLVLSSILLVFRQRGLTKNNLIILAIDYVFLFATIIAIGANWRMIPAYIVTLVLTLQVFVKPKNTIVSKKLGVKILKGAGIGVTAIAMFTLPSLFPIMTFPEPTGEYTVGTQTFHLIDKKRKELVVPNSQVNRELMVQVYYPAEKGTGKRSPYFENIDALTEQLSATQGFPHIATTHLGLTETHSYKDATPVKVKEKFPLLLFAHGMSLYGRQNTFQLEELASHGYVVVALNFTGDAATTVFPDGDRVDFTPIENTITFLNKRIKLWEQDTSFVLGEVIKGDFDKNFKPIEELIDYDKIGMLGHSFGGATSAQMLVKDDRIKAAIDMDGGLYGDAMPKNGPGKPFMLMNAEASINFMKEAHGQEPGNRDELFEESYLRNKTVEKPGVYTTIIPKTNHGSFTDLAAVTPIINESGADVNTIYKLINEMALGFFDKNLKGTNENKLEEIQKKYPEINLTKH
ncbi:carboxylic ester hydrolase [Siminovitchia terrae]|uniref:Carboxylic ester hydrolase n=1 Tax=Siminovitchia terrae TaxID=1914933 RepID=A0A429X0M7_SIMTE|nr:alpha/beta fold hydrolase [Siminovitchia terrae]RST57049.1 carboxylic ester hydrolase [Siminovitchia terrae]GIN93229.1 carboxylic ester hydrolase [Siminovitchia terrae]GIN96080.1 carboxylic ester hydrolase [Siminovitchia terrae]